MAGRIDAVELTHRLIVEHGVAVMPGAAFSLNSNPSLRVAYGTLTPSTAGEGIGRLVTGLARPQTQGVLSATRVSVVPSHHR